MCSPWSSGAGRGDEPRRILTHLASLLAGAVLTEAFRDACTGMWTVTSRPEIGRKADKDIHLPSEVPKPKASSGPLFDMHRGDCQGPGPASRPPVQNYFDRSRKSSGLISSKVCAEVLLMRSALPPPCGTERNGQLLGFGGGPCLRRKVARSWRPNLSGQHCELPWRTLITRTSPARAIPALHLDHPCCRSPAVPSAYPRPGLSIGGPFELLRRREFEQIICNHRRMFQRYELNAFGSHR